MDSQPFIIERSLALLSTQRFGYEPYHEVSWFIYKSSYMTFPIRHSYHHFRFDRSDLLEDTRREHDPYPGPISNPGSILHVT